MSRKKAGPLPDRKAACRECRRDTNHRVIAQQDTTKSDPEVGIEWSHHALLECLGCDTISYEHSFEFTDNINEAGELYTTRWSYPSRSDLPPEGVAVLLMTDIVDSTALTEQLGDAAFRAKADSLRDGLIQAIRSEGGHPADGNVLGDGVLAFFTSAATALKAAIGCLGSAKRNGLKLHIGVHAGDVVPSGETVFGGAVNIVARVTSLSGPDEILVTETVRGLARTSTPLQFDERGPKKLKGIEEPLRLSALRRDESFHEMTTFRFPRG